MPLYHFKARDKDAKEIVGERDGKDQYDLARALRAEGLTPIFVVEAAAEKKGMSFSLKMPSFLQRISLEEKLNFTRNTAVMLGAGVSLTKALEVMERQAHSLKFKDAIKNMAGSIRSGKSFAEALGGYPNIFPKFYEEMVRAGEKSGKLEESLKLISLQLKKDYAIRRKVRSALMYPAIIMIAMVGIGALMLIYVVPTLVSTFKELNVPLPASTQFIIFISESLLESGLIVLVAAAALIYSFFYWKKTKKGKSVMDLIIIKLPVIGGINQKFNSARTCRTLSSLISSGVNILEALEITKGVIQNHFYQEILEDARAKIQRGEPVSKAFLSNDILYPPLVGEMMAIGEETGELSQMLLRLASFYESEVSAATKDLSTIIEPALMVFIGIVVGFFAISMISPMYNLAGAL